MSKRSRRKPKITAMGKAFGWEDEEDTELQGQLRSILQGSTITQNVDESKESLPSLVEEAEQIMESIIKVADREMSEVEQMIFPKRQEMESTITTALQEQLQAIDNHRNHTIQAITQTLSSFKDIRDKLQGILQEIDVDLESLKGPIDQELIREMETQRNQEAEILRKEVNNYCDVHKTKEGYL